MFSTNQLEIVKSIVPTMRNQGFKYYVAYTHTNTDNSWNSSTEPDLYIVFSKEKIIAQSGYKYTIPQNSIQYICRSGNYSTSSSAVNTDRIKKENFSGTLSINLYEHIYSNAEYGESLVVMPDILGGETYAETTYIQSTNLLLATFLFFVVIWEIWKFRK